MRFDRRLAAGLLAMSLGILLPTLGVAQLFERGDEYYQATTLLGGSVEAGDLFGWSLAAGDFNGDGKDELAIGQTGEPSDTTGGHVYVLYDWTGPTSGSHGEFQAAQEWRQGAGSAGDTGNPGNWFGSELAAGDFNGDGFEDLAMAAHTDFALGIAGGLVHVLYGTASGLSAVGLQVWNQTDASPGLEPIEEGDYFGYALAAGDFNGDGKDDLAIGAWGEDLGSAINAGLVHVLYGSSSGLSTVGVQAWRQGAGGLPDAAETDDRFGDELAAGDFNGDGRDDLAIGVSGENLGAVADAGVVHVLRGTTGGLHFTANEYWHQDNLLLGELAEAGDEFGAALAAGDFDGDGKDELGIGSPGEDLEGLSLTQAGKVFVLKGGTAGLSGSQQWTETIAGGDGASNEDRFGDVLEAADFDGNGSADLAIGMPSEDLELETETRLRTGQVLVVYSTFGFGLDVTRPKQRFTEVTGGLGGQPLAEDQYGSALAAGDFDGDGVPSLAISTPWEDLFGFDWSGVVHVLEDGLLFQSGFNAGNLSDWSSSGPCPSCL
jgi:FG-GAP repeat